MADFCRIPDGEEGDEKTVRAIFAMKTIAVVGCSPKPIRPSHYVAQFQIDRGYAVFPVNPGHQELLGRKCYARLSDIPENIDLVNVFRRSEHVAAIVDEALAIGAKALWLQDGVADPVAEAKARDAGLLVVSNDCFMRRFR